MGLIKVLNTFSSRATTFFSFRTFATPGFLATAAISFGTATVSSGRTPATLGHGAFAMAGFGTGAVGFRITISWGFIG